MTAGSQNEQKYGQSHEKLSNMQENAEKQSFETKIDQKYEQDMKNQHISTKMLKNSAGRPKVSNNPEKSSKIACLQ